MYLQAIVVKSVLLMSCLFASAVAVYPEASSSASRTTEMPRSSNASLDTPLITDEPKLNSWELPEWRSTRSEFVLMADRDRWREP